MKYQKSITYQEFESNFDAVVEELLSTEKPILVQSEEEEKSIVLVPKLRYEEMVEAERMVKHFKLDEYAYLELNISRDINRRLLELALASDRTFDEVVNEILNNGATLAALKKDIEDGINSGESTPLDMSELIKEFKRKSQKKDA